MIPSLYDLIFFQARLRPEASAVQSPRGTISYRILLKHIDLMVQELQRAGVAGAGPVVLIFPRCYVHLVLILALDKINVASISFRSNAFQISWQPREDVVVISNHKPSLDAPHCWIEISENWQPDRSHHLSEITSQGPTQLSDPMVRLILTSGSTGTWKSVPIRRSILAARISEHIRDMGLNWASRVITLHPLSNGPGYWVCMATLAAGGLLILLPPKQTVGERMQTAGVLQATHVSCTPFELQLWTENSENIPSLGSVLMLETAGSRLSSKLAQEVRLAISKNLYSLFGATEAGRIAFGRSPMNVEHATGFVNPYCHVQIVNEEDVPMRCGQEGIMRIKSPGLVDGYYEDTVMSARCFRNGWFYSGDTGVLEADGLLRITGRVDDVVNVRGGAKISLAVVEEKLRALIGVKDASVFGVTGLNQDVQIWAAIVKGNSLDQQALLSAVKQHIIHRVLYVLQLPRNENGKVVRRALTEQAARILAQEVAP